MLFRSISFTRFPKLVVHDRDLHFCEKITEAHDFVRQVKVLESREHIFVSNITSGKNKYGVKFACTDQLSELREEKEDFG